MKVNVSKAFISKTFMSGLKVSFKKQQTEKQKQNQLQQRQLTKSNNKSLEFYLQLVKIFTKNPLATRQQQDLVVALIILKEFATFASKTTTTIIIIPLLILVQYIIISFNVFSRLTVLMNDFRLKTFYCKSSKTTKNKFNKNKTLKINNNKTTTTSTSSTLYSFKKTPHNSRFPLTNSLINLKISSTLSTPTFSSTAGGAAAASAVAFATSATLLLQQTSSKNNNHHRTYNNSSKSNKVFLYYTPRDPRLRIFLKTKHLFNRPQQQQPQLINTIKNIHNSNNSCCLKSVKSLLSDLCNYGELIGGSIQKSGEYKNNFSENNNKTIVKQLNSVNCNLYKPKKDNCDNLKSDSLIIVATAGAANETISANILFVIFSVAVLSEYAQELLRTIEILLR